MYSSPVSTIAGAHATIALPASPHSSPLSRVADFERVARILIFLLLVFLPAAGWAQEISVRGGASLTTTIFGRRYHAADH